MAAVLFYQSVWTEEREDVLQRLVADGLTAAQIAAQMGCGITRNAVVGKVSRMGLRLGFCHGQPRLSPQRVWPPALSDEQQIALRAYAKDGLSGLAIARAIGASRQAVTGYARAQNIVLTPHSPVRLRQPSFPPEPEPEAQCRDDGSPVTLADVRGDECRWPHGEPDAGAFHLCGQAVRPGSPYCAHHTRRAHQPHQHNRDARVAAQGAAQDSGSLRVFGGAV